MAVQRRLPTWLLVVVTAAVGIATYALEAADLFPAWRFAVQWSPEALASSSVVPPSEIASGVPVLSLTLNDKDLNDPKTGLLPNKLEHGEEWEREGSVTYFENGRLGFAAAVGVRVHGGSSRQSAEKVGFRLYFRRRYGPRDIPPGVLFSPATDPVRRLVIHDDVRKDPGGVSWYFVNPLAYDIARAVGAIAPETKPVRFFVNGEYYGPFVLTERFDERFFAAHFGYDDILLSQEAMNGLHDWVLRTRPLTMGNVSRYVNLDNLTRWFVAVAFSATRDAYQGPGQFLDRTKSTGGWFWVNWDMDQSFRDWNHDSYQYLLERIDEQRRGRNPAEPRPLILTHLIAEDPAYRQYFKRVVQDALNHELTDAFLQERYEHYLDTATQLRVPRLDYTKRLRVFVQRRRAFFRLISEQWLNSPPSQPVVLRGPSDRSFIIDGHRVPAGYRGLYFPDVEVTVDVEDAQREGLLGWRVNDRIVKGSAPLRFRAGEETEIQALYGTIPSVQARAQAQPPPPVAPARLEWRTIPAGTSWMGCVPGDDRCDSAEQPRVQTTFAQPYQMLDREVTGGDFHAYAAASGTQMPRQPEWYANDTHPVVNVTWDEAQQYCAWAGGRLPTEEEWEHAARGGLDGRLFPWGDEFAGQAVARHNLPEEKFNFTAPVGLFPPNGYGLQDVAGNVWEWTASEHRPTHNTDPDRSYDLRTIKGGGWDNNIRRLRVSERAALARNGRHNLYVGFRCVRAVPAGAGSQKASR